MGKGLDDARAALALAFTALNSASDAFTPFKSVSGGLLFCVDLVQTIQSNKEEYAKLLERIANIAHDLANADSSSESTRLGVRLRASLFEKCLERLTVDLQPVSRRRVLLAKQHREIIRGCNEELDRLVQAFSMWADLLLVRDVGEIRKSLLEATARMDHLRQNPTRLALSDITAIADACTERIQAHAQVPPIRPQPDPPPDPLLAISLRGLRFSVSPQDGVSIHIAPATCVLFA
ncbi:hypothetical protein EXIGLDRAFT_172931 [Exidia glandulosa HHB12029]|uniref:Uncharacterized protein n=1 Tax=Exidia glandulosa HHB12029 TaxID=1314781 RepID=A0A165F9L3_EXIGL|nr:hypothetical protein EXIGLDRAFT_172931 [Exidia glandulosa HHB12029]